MALEGGWLREGGIHNNTRVWTIGARLQRVNLSVSPGSHVGLVIDDPAGRPEKGLV